MKKRSVAILVYDSVEVLDFAAPFEVFAVTDELNDGRYFDVALVAADDVEYRAVNGMRVLPNQVLGQIAAPDVVVAPGGNGSKTAMHDPRLLQWLRTASASAEIVMSACSGARLLGEPVARRTAQYMEYDWPPEGRYDS